MTIRPTPPLYKYMGSKRFIEMLRSTSIRFTQPDFLNDPYECHLTLDREALKADYRKHRKAHSPEMTDGQLDHSVEMAEDQLVIDALLHYRDRRRNLGILSLTEDPLQLLMWAHYGEEHRGVVVEFDISHPCIRPGSNGGDTYSGIEKVTYSKDKIFGIPMPDTMIDVLSRKSPEWEYEREWRLIRTLNMTRRHSEEICVVDFDLSAVKSVHLGARFPAQHLDEVTQLLNANGGAHIKLWKVDIAPHRFELRVTEVEQYGWKLLHREHHFGEAAAEALTCLPMETDINAG